LPRERKFTSAWKLDRSISFYLGRIWRFHRCFFAPDEGPWARACSVNIFLPVCSYRQKIMGLLIPVDYSIREISLALYNAYLRVDNDSYCPRLFTRQQTIHLLFEHWSNSSRITSRCTRAHFGDKKKPKMTIVISVPWQFSWCRGDIQGPLVWGLLGNSGSWTSVPYLGFLSLAPLLSRTSTIDPA
jgi:hypothetical protein